jgi:hypothetical protein
MFTPAGVSSPQRSQQLPPTNLATEDGQKADAANFTVFTKTVYDALGRVSLVTNPYRAQAASTDGWARTAYDLAGRVTEVASFVYLMGYGYDARGNLTRPATGNKRVHSPTTGCRA